MTPLDKIIEIIASLSFDLWTLVKILVCLGFLIYLAFAVIVVRQVSLMLRTLSIDFEALLRLIAWVHLFTAIGLFILALVVL